MSTRLDRRALLLLLGAAALIRLFVAYIWLPGGGFPTDLSTFAGWGLYLADHGSASFYRSAGFTDYPPAYLYVLWGLGLLAHLSGDVVGAMGSLLKLPAMAADLGVGLLLAAMVFRARAPRPDASRLALLAAGLYLLNPLVIYDSALWGQVEAVGMLAMLLCVWALTEGSIELALPAMVLAGLIKPQFGLILIPVVLVLVVRRHFWRPGSGPQPSGRLAFLAGRPGWLRVLVGGLAATALFGAICLPFGMLPWDLVKLAYTEAGTYPYLTVNAYNPWALIAAEGGKSMAAGGGWHPDSVPALFGLTAFQLGGLLMGTGMALVALLTALRDDRRTIILAVIAGTLVFFTLPTRVHERYLFAVVAFLPLLAITSRRYFALLAILSLGTLANLHGVLLSYATGATAALPLGDVARDQLTVTLVALTSLGALAFVFADSEIGRRLPALRLRLEGDRRPPGDDPLTAPSIFEPTPSVEAPPARAVTPAKASSRAPEPAPAQTSAGSTWSLVADTGRVLLALAQAGPAKARQGLGWRDGALAAVFVALTFVTRFAGIGQPASMYFDEVYHARTATEFLQDWRYGIPHDIYEFTHPHLAKYLMAAGITAFGDNRVIATGALAGPVLDAVIEPRYEGTTNPAAKHGERLFIATGTSVEVYDLPSRAYLASLPFAATALALDTAGHHLYAIDSNGDLASWPTAGLAGGTNPGLAKAAAAFDRLAASPDGATLYGTQGSVITAFDATGAVKARQDLGVAISTVLPTSDGVLVGAADASLRLLGTADLTMLSRADLPGVPTDLALLPLAGGKLYVATSGGLVHATLSGGQVGTPIALTTPGAIRALAYDPSSALLHALGQAPDGSGDTVYVIEPNGDAVFADAPLSFTAARILADATPAYPGSDPQQILALSDGGQLGVIDAGGNATAWRLPGVLAGAALAGLLFLLARLLFRRRTAALAVGAFALLDGMFFASARIAMNDIYVTTFIVAAYTLFAALWLGHWRGRAAILAGLPAVGLLLGLALASKWVGLYAIGGVGLLVLARSRLGRWIIVGGLVLITGTLGIAALAEGNLAFMALMLVLTALVTVLVASHGAGDGEAALPAFMRPGPGWIWAALCLAVLPVGVYIASYTPWVALGNSWLGPAPAGHQNLIDLTASMYNYHDQLRATHPAGSPWWAWPLDLKPVWFAAQGAAGNLSASIYDAGNLVVFWMAIPALVFAAIAARARRDLGLAFVVIAFAAAWLPWARIDRVTFEYHYFSALPFAVLALGALVGELWSAKAPGLAFRVRLAFFLARIGAAAAVCLPALLWLIRGPLCAVSGADGVTTAAQACGPGANASPWTVLVALAAIGAIVAAAQLWSYPGWQVRRWILVGAGFAGVAVVVNTTPKDLPFLVPFLVLTGSAIIASLIMTMTNPRRLAMGILAGAGACAALFYPMVSATPISGDWTARFNEILPTFNYYFQFSSDTAASPTGPGLPFMVLITGLLAVNVVGLVRLIRRVWPTRA